MEKVKAKSKVMPTANSLNKKNNTVKTISVNKQMQYKKKTPIKNQINEVLIPVLKNLCVKIFSRKIKLKKLKRKGYSQK